MNFTDMKRIPGYTRYFIDTNGKVKSSITNKFLKGNTDSRGYVRYKLKNGNYYKLEYAHRLVIITFGTVPRHGQYHVKHIDNDKSNNRLDNLKCVDSKLHNYNSSFNRLTDEDKKYIENNQLDKVQDISDKLNVSKHLVYKEIRHIKNKRVRFYRGTKILKLHI